MPPTTPRLSGYPPGKGTGFLPLRRLAEQGARLGVPGCANGLWQDQSFERMNRIIRIILSCDRRSGEPPTRGTRARQSAGSFSAPTPAEASVPDLIDPADPVHPVKRVAGCARIDWRTRSTGGKFAESDYQGSRNRTKEIRNRNGAGTGKGEDVEAAKEIDCREMRRRRRSRLSPSLIPWTTTECNPHGVQDTWLVEGPARTL